MNNKLDINVFSNKDNGLRKNRPLHLHAVEPGNLAVTIGVPLGSC